MKCAKKKVKKFAEGGWSTSSSFDEKDAAERAAAWAAKSKKSAPAAKKSTPAPRVYPKPDQEAVRGGGAMGANGYKAPTPQPKWDTELKIDTGAPLRPLKKFGERVGARTAKMADEQKPKANTAKYEPTMGKSIGAWWKKAKEGSKRIKDAQAKPYAKGGSVRGDGCATKGKTKGRHC